MTTDSTSTADVLIIGAGAAALGAMSTFAGSGLSTLIVDKGRRPGGRLATRRADTRDVWFDHGAQYITARDPDFRALVGADCRRGRLARWQPRLGVAEARDNGFAVKASPDERERFVGPAGVNAWIRARLETSPASVVPATRIQTLTPEASGWRAITANHEIFAAPRVIVTTPPAQAAKLLGNTARSIEALADASTCMTGCQTIVIRAPAHPRFDALFVHGARLAWVADNASKRDTGATGDHLWTLHAGVNYSEAHIDAEPESLADALIEEFVAMTGFERAAITFVYGHRWRYARTSPSAPVPPGPLADRPVAGMPDHGLALAGDWLAGGRVEGAWRAGIAAAQAL